MAFSDGAALGFDAGVERNTWALGFPMLVIFILVVKFLKEFSLDDRPSDAPEVVKYFISFEMLLLAVLTLPLFLSAVATTFSLQLLDPACPTPRLKEYTWLVLDSVAKGMLLDLMESFHIDIHTCGPNDRSYVASTVVFLIRSFSTYIVVLS
jgi:hypothetical protein